MVAFARACLAIRVLFMIWKVSQSHSSANIGDAARSWLSIRVLIYVNN